MTTTFVYYSMMTGHPQGVEWGPIRLTQYVEAITQSIFYIDVAAFCNGSQRSFGFIKAKGFERYRPNMLHTDSNQLSLV